MPRGVRTSFSIGLIELFEFLSTKATRGASMFRDLFLDPRQFPGTLSRILLVGIATKRPRAFGLGVEQTTEEIG